MKGSKSAYTFDTLRTVVGGMDDGTVLPPVIKSMAKPTKKARRARRKARRTKKQQAEEDHKRRRGGLYQNPYNFGGSSMPPSDSVLRSNGDVPGAKNTVSLPTLPQANQSNLDYIIRTSNSMVRQKHLHISLAPSKFGMPQSSGELLDFRQHSRFSELGTGVAHSCVAGKVQLPQYLSGGGTLQAQSTLATQLLREAQEAKSDISDDDDDDGGTRTKVTGFSDDDDDSDDGSDSALKSHHSPTNSNGYDNDRPRSTHTASAAIRKEKWDGMAAAEFGGPRGFARGTGGGVAHGEPKVSFYAQFVAEKKAKVKILKPLLMKHLKAAGVRWSDIEDTLDDVDEIDELDQGIKEPQEYLQKLLTIRLAQLQNENDEDI